MAVAKCVGAARVARQAAVCADGYRSPQVELLLGGDGVVQRVDNGIRSGSLTNHCRAALLSHCGCCCLLKDPKAHKRLKRTLFNRTKQGKTCKFLRKSSFSSYIQHKNRKRSKKFHLALSVRCWEAGGRPEDFLENVHVLSS